MCTCINLPEAVTQNICGVHVHVHTGHVHVQYKYMYMHIALDYKQLIKASLQVYLHIQ